VQQDATIQDIETDDRINSHMENWKRKQVSALQKERHLPVNINNIISAFLTNENNSLRCDMVVVPNKMHPFL
jgi:hypothetical protein